jgi:hypothetical protein
MLGKIETMEQNRKRTLSSIKGVVMREKTFFFGTQKTVPSEA